EFLATEPKRDTAATHCSVVEVSSAESFLQLDPPVQDHRDRRVDFFYGRYDEKSLAIRRHVVTISGHLPAIPAVKPEQLARAAEGNSLSQFDIHRHQVAIRVNEENLRAITPPSG